MTPATPPAATGPGQATPTAAQLSDLRARIAQQPRTVITTHVRPDGDAMGSALGIFHLLQQLGLTAEILVPTEVPDYLAWLPGAERAIVAEAEPERARALAAQAELAFCLDFGLLDRAGDVIGPAVRQSAAYKVHLDHHLDLEPFAHVLLRHTEASSTCELALEFQGLLAPELPPTQAGATCLYTGIVTDTGSFRFDSATPAVHRAVAQLIEAGVPVGQVHHALFNNSSEARLRFIGFCLAERLTVLPELRTAYIAVQAADLRRFNMRAGDTEGLVSYTLGIRGVNLGCLLIEYPSEVKLSLRSVGKFSAAAFATHFAGGGHYNAAGGRSTQNLADTVARFEQLVAASAADLQYNHPF